MLEQRQIDGYVAMGREKDLAAAPLPPEDTAFGHGPEDENPAWTGPLPGPESTLGNRPSGGSSGGIPQTVCGVWTTRHVNGIWLLGGELTTDEREDRMGIIRETGTRQAHHTAHDCPQRPELGLVQNCSSEIAIKSHGTPILLVPPRRLLANVLRFSCGRRRRPSRCKRLLARLQFETSLSSVAAFPSALSKVHTVQFERSAEASKCMSTHPKPRPASLRSAMKFNTSSCSAIGAGGKALNKPNSSSRLRRVPQANSPITKRWQQTPPLSSSVASWLLPFLR